MEVAIHGVIPKFIIDIGKTFFRYAVLSPFYAAYGAFFVLRALARLIRGASATRLCARRLDDGLASRLADGHQAGADGAL